MRIDLANLDPASPLACRIRSAMARDLRAMTAPESTGGDFLPSAGLGAKITKRPSAAKSEASTGIADPWPWHREEDLHRAVVELIAAEARPGVIAFHVPNGGRRGKAEAGKLKALGTLAGVPDMIVLADGRAFGLEIKTSAGRLSKAQKLMAGRFDCAGIPFEVAHSLTGARLILARWGVLASASDMIDTRNAA